jgi:hypothetical protein
MIAPFDPIEDGAGIGDKLGERTTACRAILGGSVANDPVKTFSADEREIGCPGLCTPLGTTGDVNGPFKAEPG